MSLRMALHCVRNTVIEDYHAGISPSSKTGDYSDVKVVTPYGEIPWNEVSRLSNNEMETFNKEVVNKIFSFLHIWLNPQYQKYSDKFFNGSFPLFYPPHDWDKPRLDKDFMTILTKLDKKNEN